MAQEKTSTQLKASEAGNLLASMLKVDICPPQGTLSIFHFAGPHKSRHGPHQQMFVGYDT